MVISLVAFTLNDTIMKAVLGDLPLFQAVFIRGIAASLLLLIIGIRLRVFARGSLTMGVALVVRVAAEIGGTITFFTALAQIPIADATAITQVTPLAVTLGAALFLGEKVGWRRSVAIAVGFAGVMVIVRPGLGAFSSYSYFALGTVLFIAIRDLASHRLPPQTSSIGVAFVTSLATTLLAGPLSLSQPWIPVEGGHLLLLVTTAALLCVGYIFSVMMMRTGDVSFSAPFRYLSLPIAIVTGILVFGDFPDLWTLLGSLVVIGTGIYTFQRERRVTQLNGEARLAAATAPPP